MTIKISLVKVAFSAFLTVLAASAFAAPKGQGLRARAPRAPRVVQASELAISSATGVVLRINGIDVSADEYRNRVDMVVALARIKNPKVSEVKLSQYRAKLLSTEFRRIAQRLVISSKIFSPTNDAVVITTNSTAYVKAKYVNSFLPKSKKKMPAEARFATLLESVRKAGYADFFKSDFDFDVKLDSYIHNHCADKVIASAADIAEAKRNVAEYNRIASATNALQETLCNELIRRVGAGEDFATLADRYSQDEEKAKGGRLGESTEVDYEGEPGYWQRVSRVPVGGVSDLIITSEGYEIVRVNKVISANDSSSGFKSLDLSRIFRRKAYVFPEQTDDEFAADIAKEKREKFYKDFIRETIKNSKISFPQGGNIFKPVKKGTKQ